MSEAIAILSEYELERGKPMPSKNHSFVQKRILVNLELHYSNQFEVLPELSLDLPVRDRVPDLAIYDKRQLSFTPGADEIKVSEIPLCMIEIMSPTQNFSEFHHKRREYFKAGTKSYWLILPDLLTVYVYHELEDYEIFTRKDKLVDRQLGIEIDLGEIFR
ncbi:MAG: Uma2 family endonuclease [Saprospiraceae bacterium]|nr:Uma2 family endonuclease [Saprospiraceae bacterium]